MKQTSRKKSPKKNVVVDRKFLLKLANDIYDPKSKSYLRLCTGTLQNGPDPKDAKRPMHCGLGELYFAMTGLQPEETDVSEDDVVHLAVELSPLHGLRAKAEQDERDAIKQAMRAIEKLKLSDDAKETLKDTLHDLDQEIDNRCDDPDDLEASFREALDEIPNVNDADCGHESCSAAEFRARSQRVASQLRAAAAVIPAKR